MLTPVSGTLREIHCDYGDRCVICGKYYNCNYVSVKYCDEGKCDSCVHNTIHNEQSVCACNLLTVTKLVIELQEQLIELETINKNLLYQLSLW